MVLEVAHVTVLPGHEADFEVALLEAASTVLPQADGFLEFTAHRWSVERPQVYLFTIRWETHEHHTEGFRGSPEYLRWRELLHGFYDPFPEVWHFTPFLAGSAGVTGSTGVEGSTDDPAIS